MRVASSDGVEIEVYDLGGDGPDLLVAHATGFCAGAYLPLAARLSERHHVWALDFRAHGASTSPVMGDLNWEGMTDDALAVIDAIGPAEPILSFGHSMGGACLAAAELRRPGTIARAVLFEPIIVPPGFGADPGGNPMAASARRRRPSFPSRREALDRYASRPPLGTFRADALWAYVQYGFDDGPDGTASLACRPEDEAAVFEAAGKPQIADMGGVATATLVMCGGRDDHTGPAAFAPVVAHALAHGTLRRYPHLSHFGPFQDPDTLADDTLDFLAAG
ncbi:MAG: alpha/beta fold hydrolase [Acidimicrobiales bacterium]